MEAIVLAGGMGTRLQSVLSNLPKPMAPIGGKPFLSYLMKYLTSHGISRLILSTGYRHVSIENYYGRSFEGIPIVYSVEEEPLGTGGAVKRALQHVSGDSVFIINGDTYFNIELHMMRQLHMETSSDFSMALKSMRNFDRYGTVEREGCRVVKFVEKQTTEKGNINGGIYLMRSDLIDRFDLPERFSLETDFTQKYLHQMEMNGFLFDQYFIDIGIPEDYNRAQRELILK